MTFRMADRIILEQQLDSVTVQVECMTYPVSRPTGEDMVTLTRDSAFVPGSLPSNDSGQHSWRRLS